jgi:hypothetical protein
LAEVSTFRAQELANEESNESHSESLAWAQIASSGYEFLAENNPSFSESYLKMLKILGIFSHLYMTFAMS